MKSLALKTAVMTQNVRRRAREWGESVDRDDHVERSVPQQPTVSRDHLVESEEYEWSSPLSLPGLIVAARATPPPFSTDVRPSQRILDHVIETEDGDAVSATQLPGCLGGHYGARIMDVQSPRVRNELADEDEYVEVAAWQLPGQLILTCSDAVGPREPSIQSRGLCATCLYRDSCDFPKPDGGVWQCEEYA